MRVFGTVILVISFVCPARANTCGRSCLTLLVHARTEGVGPTGTLPSKPSRCCDRTVPYDRYEFQRQPQGPVESGSAKISSCAFASLFLTSVSARSEGSTKYGFESEHSEPRCLSLVRNLQPYIVIFVWLQLQCLVPIILVGLGYETKGSVDRQPPRVHPCIQVNFA